jgi:hypothetical protein
MPQSIGRKRRNRPKEGREAGGSQPGSAISCAALGVGKPTSRNFASPLHHFPMKLSPVRGRNSGGLNQVLEHEWKAVARLEALFNVFLHFSLERIKNFLVTTLGWHARKFAMALNGCDPKWS